MSRFAVAQHESRHGAMALLLNFELQALVLSADGESGECRWTCPPGALPLHRIYVALAGVAQDPQPYCGRGDLSQAEGLYRRWMRESGRPMVPFELRLPALLKECTLLLLDQSGVLWTLTTALLDSRTGRLDAWDLRALGLAPPPRAVVCPRDVPRPPPRAAPPRRRYPLTVDVSAEDRRNARAWLKREGKDR